MSTTRDKRDRRHRKIRYRINGTKDIPRLAVFRSNRYIYAQLVDDVSGKTLASADSRALPAGRQEKKLGRGEKGSEEKEKSNVRKKEREAHRVGTALAERAREKGITKARFDRAGFRYAGRVRALAEGGREGGLEF